LPRRWRANEDTERESLFRDWKPTNGMREQQFDSSPVGRRSSFQAPILLGKFTPNQVICSDI
jgi:hypothetical protein